MERPKEDSAVAPLCLLDLPEGCFWQVVQRLPRTSRHLLGRALGRGRFAELRLPPGTPLRVSEFCHSPTLLAWARQEGAPWGPETAAVIAAGGHLAVLRCARDGAVAGGRLEWDARTCTAAARGGHMELLQWARVEGCLWTPATAEAAAAGGHGELLRWAAQAGCPMDGRVCTAAAAHGRLELLQWAREQGCPWDSWTVSRMPPHLPLRSGCPR